MYNIVGICQFYTSVTLASFLGSTVFIVGSFAEVLV